MSWDSLTQTLNVVGSTRKDVGVDDDDDVRNEIIDQYIGNKAKQKPQKSESDKNQDWFQTFLCEKTSMVSAFTRKGLFEPAWLWESEKGFQKSHLQI